MAFDGLTLFEDFALLDEGSSPTSSTAAGSLAILAMVASCFDSSDGWCTEGKSANVHCDPLTSELTSLNRAVYLLVVCVIQNRGITAEIRRCRGAGFVQPQE